MICIEHTKINYQTYKTLLQDIIWFAPFQNSNFNNTFLVKKGSDNILIYNFSEYTPIVSKMTISLFTKDCKKIIDSIINEKFRENPKLLKISVDIIEEEDISYLSGEKYLFEIEAKLREHAVIEDKLRDVYIASTFKEEQNDRFRKSK